MITTMMMYKLSF